MQNHKITTPSICIVYTGGTMGSKRSATTGLLEPAPLHEFENRVAELRPETWNASLSFTQIDGPLIDSASAAPSDWLRMRGVLEREWSKFDGFVVVHGTDTMPYAGAFLSFAIEYQDKPVVVTGSMEPIFEPGDASANLKASVHVAASRTQDDVPLDQVLICFGGRILRGNRTAKVGSRYTAISTPRVRDLGKYATKDRRWGIPVWDEGPPIRQVAPEGNSVHFPPLKSSRVVLLRLFPGITPDLVRTALRDADGVVVEAYGSGTGPNDVRECLKELANEGLVVAVATEAVWGKIKVGCYATDLVEDGGPLVPCRTMLAETALAKLHYLLGKFDRTRSDEREKVVRLMQDSIRGETGDFEPRGTSLRGVARNAERGVKILRKFTLHRP